MKLFLPRHFRSLMIKQTCMSACCAMLLAASSAQAYTGNDLARWVAANQRYELAPNNATPEDYVDSAILIGYVTGVLDTLDLTGTICRPPQIPPRQLIAIVKKELDANPENWSGSAGSIAIIAFASAFPCRKK